MADRALPLGDNRPVMTVGELSQALKNAVEEAFAWVRVRGEISGFKRAASGHLYFSLKDTNAVLDAVCWRGTAGRLQLRPEDGLEVIATGKLTTYPGRSRYQIVVERLELSGEGALLKLLEERKRKLTAEGLFAEERKKALPYLPGVIGVVTSPTGAVIRDILHRIGDRFPSRVVVWPVLVQGDAAAAQVAAAIEGFNALAPDGPVPRPDLLIVARGGGSLEDLWGFNEEAVTRAAAASTIPLISAVGHETDTTLIDLAADRRAPTPTAAAEMAVPVRAELMTQIVEIERRLIGGLHRHLAERRTRVEGLARGLPQARDRLGTASQRFDDWSERLGGALHGMLSGHTRGLAQLRPPHPRHLLALKAGTLGGLNDRLALRGPALELRRATDALAEAAAALAPAWQQVVDDGVRRIETGGRLLESYSYRGVLARGFAVVRDGKDRPIASLTKIKHGQALSLEFLDGRVPVIAAGKPVRRKQKPDPDQGSLL